MPRQFNRLTLAEFSELVAGFRWSRRIESVHLHHTWRPDHAMWAGFDSMKAMWRHHTRVNGWSDIAQHLTVDPDGFVWTGRDWNRPPASAAGRNGSRAAGPFMIEIVGNFDDGADLLEGVQRDAAIEAIGVVQCHHDLPPRALLLHREMSAKSCPGSTVDRSAVMGELRASRRRVSRSISRPTPSRELPTPSPFSEESSLVAQLIARSVGRDTDSFDKRNELPDEPPGAELTECMHATPGTRATPGASGGQHAARLRNSLGKHQFGTLRPHVVNLRDGSLVPGGVYDSSPADVDAIFAEHLPRWADAQPPGDPLRVVFYAHGGLVSERRGLAIAQRHIAWWKSNGIYPIYFVWETGLADALRSVLRAVAARIRRRTRRDVWDDTLDPLVEAGCRALGGAHIWSAMKRSAERAAEPASGGGWYVAERLAAYCRMRNERTVELHAIGHSAGAVFHAHFIQATQQVIVPPFVSLQLLAPAVRIDAFRRLLAPLLGSQVQRCDIFTMQRRYEKRDNCMNIYHKSLLYLIHRALERERSAPLLGLESSLRADAEIASMFGLGGEQGAFGSVVWSVSSAAEGPDASHSTAHGGFDDDPATMNSLATRVLGVTPPVPYTASEAAARSMWESDDAWMEESAALDAGVYGDAGWLEDADTEYGDAPGEAEEGPSLSVPASPAYAPSTSGRGRRFALCVGIDSYPAPHALAGCVNDANAWGVVLQARGFEVVTLLDGAATRTAIARELSQLVRRARRGDVAVFQFSGHGTQLYDVSGDEGEGLDEALVPADFASGAYLTDDDLREILSRVRDGVRLTSFMDCCHSHTITRLLVGIGDDADGRATPRLMPATAEMQAAHRRFRVTAPRPRGVSADRSAMRWVSFSASEEHELAYEENGQGDFTRHALAVLARPASHGYTLAGFQGQVTRRFGKRRRQTPRLDCPPGASSQRLLAPEETAVNDPGADPSTRFARPG